jgi:hypothetical protein
LRVIHYVLLPLPEVGQPVLLQDELEPGCQERGDLRVGGGHFDVEVVGAVVLVERAFDVDVDLDGADAPVAQEFFHPKRVLGLVVFQGSAPVADAVKVDG